MFYLNKEKTKAKLLVIDGARTKRSSWQWHRAAFWKTQQREKTNNLTNFDSISQKGQIAQKPQIEANIEKGGERKRTFLGRRYPKSEQTTETGLVRLKQVVVGEGRSYPDFMKDFAVGGEMLVGRSRGDEDEEIDCKEADYCSRKLTIIKWVRTTASPVGGMGFEPHSLQCEASGFTAPTSSAHDLIRVYAVSSVEMPLWSALRALHIGGGCRFSPFGSHRFFSPF
ncbi:hypothetical protein LXL04_003159 [Taraxacum kok-saghyz]